MTEDNRTYGENDVSDNFSAPDPQGDPEQLESAQPTGEGSPSEPTTGAAEQTVTESASEAESTGSEAE